VIIIIHTIEWNIPSRNGNCPSGAEGGGGSGGKGGGPHGGRDDEGKRSDGGGVSLARGLTPKGSGSPSRRRSADPDRITDGGMRWSHRVPNVPGRVQCRGVKRVGSGSVGYLAATLSYPTPLKRSGVNIKATRPTACKNSIPERGEGR